VQASALNKEILVLLRSYNDILAQNRANIPNDLQPIIEKVDIGSQSSARHSYNDNHSGEGRGNDGDPDVLSTMTPLIIILSTGTPILALAGSATTVPERSEWEGIALSTE
jgi:hypothetical protein